MRTAHGLRRPMATLTTVATLIALTATAQAWELDPNTGKVRTTADVAWNCEGFEDLPQGLNFEAFSPRFDFISPAQLETIFEKTDIEALEGEGACVLGGSVAFVTIRLTELNARFEGRRVSINFWLQPRGTKLNARVYWVAGSAPPQAAEPIR